MPGRNLLGRCESCCIPPPPPVVGRCESITASEVTLCGFAAFVEDLRELPIEVRVYQRVQHSGRDIQCTHDIGGGCDEASAFEGSLSRVIDISGEHIVDAAVECAPNFWRGRMKTEQNYRCFGTPVGTPVSAEPFAAYNPGPWVDETAVTRRWHNPGTCVFTGTFDLYTEWDVTAFLSISEPLKTAILRQTYTEGTECTAYTGEEVDEGRTLGGGVRYVEYFLQFDPAWEGQTVVVLVTYRTITDVTLAIDDSLVDELTVAVPVGGEVGPIPMPQPPGGKSRSVLSITFP